VNAMNCRVCGTPLFIGRSAFRCSCGALTHSWCWDKHVLEAHKPSFTIGTVDLDGNFTPSEKANEVSPFEKETAHVR